MIELVIAFDDSDDKLGVYFTLCKDDSIEIINSIDANKAKINFTELRANICNSAYIDISLKPLKSIPFIWVSFSHGNDTSVTIDDIPYVQVGNDNSLFKNSFFYTNSCSSGKLLAKDLISQECRVFIGYNRKVYAFKNEYTHISLKCDTIGLTSFLTEDITVFEAYTNMHKLYTQEAFKLSKIGDPLASGLLLSARESLVFEGDKNAKASDFEIS